MAQAPGESVPSSSAPLFFQQRFLPMWTALSFGTFADNILRQSLLIGIPAGVITVPFVADADDAIPFIGALLPAAILLFSSISGQLADKYETSTMFRRTKFVEVLLMIAAALAFISDMGGLVIASLFLMGAQSAFFSPVRVGAMPKYLRTNELVRGNGLCNAGLFTFILLGYVVGGYLIVQEGGGMAVGAALIGASLIGWIAALNTPFAAANDPDLKISFNGFAQTAAMFRLAQQTPGVAPPLLGVAVFFLLSTAVTVTVPLYGRDSLISDPLVWTALNGLFAIGAGLGAIGAAALAKGRSGLGYSAAAIFAGGVMSFAAYFLTPYVAGEPGAPLRVGDLVSTPGGLALALVFIATAAFSGVYIAPLQAAIQRRARRETRARIMAASIFANAAFAIVGSLSVLAITRSGADPRLAFLCVGAMMMAIGGIMAYRRRTLPDGLYDEELASPG